MKYAIIILMNLTIGSAFANTNDRHCTFSFYEDTIEFSAKWIESDKCYEALAKLGDKEYRYDCSRTRHHNQTAEEVKEDAALLWVLKKYNIELEAIRNLETISVELNADGGGIHYLEVSMKDNTLERLGLLSSMGGVSGSACTPQSTASLSASYDVKLTLYVKSRLYKRQANGSMAPSAKELIDRIAKEDMLLKDHSLRCIGYSAPDGSGKAVGVCLIKASDAKSQGERLVQKYAILVSTDIEHPDTSRNWEVALQQNIYF